MFRIMQRFKNLLNRNTFDVGLVSLLALFGLLWVVHGIIVRKTATDAMGSRVTEIVNDVIRGTNTAGLGDQKYTLVYKDIFSDYQVKLRELTPMSAQLDSSDLLEFSSLKTQDSITEMIQLLNGASKELNNYENILKELTFVVTKKANDSQVLTDVEKKDLINGFNDSINSVSQLRKERNNSLVGYYSATRELYEFLGQNFDDYEIFKDDTGQENILFKTDSIIEKYYVFVQKVSESQKNFQQADKKAIDFANTTMKNFGVDVDAGELRDAMTRGQTGTNTTLK